VFVIALGYCSTVITVGTLSIKICWSLSAPSACRLMNMLRPSGMIGLSFLANLRVHGGRPGLLRISRKA
jgi:hypothetical protein